MPVVNVKVFEGVFSPHQKQEIVEKLTDTIVSIKGDAMRGVTMVIVDEVTSGDWGSGGRAMTTGDVKALAGSSPPANGREGAGHHRGIQPGYFGGPNKPQLSDFRRGTE